jgi:predicted RNA-binding protein YlqC (UPF0109 family)
VSAFDDEFGLFGDDEATPEEERKSTLGARQIATNESFSDDIEPEDERPARRRPGGAGSDRSGGGERRPYRDRDHGPRPAGDPAVAQARAVELLTFLAKRLVSHPDDVIVSVVDGARGPIIELEVNPEDFGKVIGKGGRVAQALRTIVRASAEGKVTIDIVDVEDDDAPEPDLEQAVDTSAAEPEDAVAEAPAAKVKKPAAKKKAPAKKTPAVRKKSAAAAAAPKRKKKA